MSEAFQEYAQYYDLLYRDKDYSREAQFIHQIIRRFAPDAKKILELGSGTGIHAIEMAKMGYSVTGVEISPEMLTAARARLAGHSVRGNVEFVLGDIRSFRSTRAFDVVISLFHVMSYQITNSDVFQAMATAKEHLRGHGLFVFDAWYGPGVLTERPEVREKCVENETMEIVRIASPVMVPEQNRVDVNYSVSVKDKPSGRVNEIRETHRMRYFFDPEAELFLNQSGFELIESGEWLTGKKQGFNSWNAYYVGRAGE